MPTLLAVDAMIPAATSGWVPSRPYRMAVDEYEAMVASGAFEARRRSHLINRYLVETMTRNPPHRVVDEPCGVEMGRILAAGRHRVAAARPVRITGRDGGPGPDRCVVRGTIRDLAGRHPGPGEIALVVEVADSGPADGRRLAAVVYGPAGIPACWIVDPIRRQVDVSTEPGPQGHGSRGSSGGAGPSLWRSTDKRSARSRWRISGPRGPLPPGRGRRTGRTAFAPEAGLATVPGRRPDVESDPGL